MSYDANGNMIGDGTRTLSFDAANRLAYVTQNGVTVTFACGLIVERYIPSAAITSVMKNRGNGIDIERRF